MESMPVQPAPYNNGSYIPPPPSAQQQYAPVSPMYPSIAPPAPYNAIPQAPAMGQQYQMPAPWVPGMPFPVINCPCGYRGMSIIESHLPKKVCCWSWIIGLFLLPPVGIAMCCCMKEQVPACPNCHRIHALGEYKC